MFGMRKACGIGALAFALVATGGCLAIAKATSNNTSQAKIEILTESDTELAMRFTDANGWGHTVNFYRVDAESIWWADTSSYPTTGIVFGNEEPTYASTAQLRALGISANEAVRTFDTSIVDRPLDDITLYRTRGENLAIGIWQEDSITELHYVGLLVGDLLQFQHPDGGNTCDSAVALCCREFDIPFNTPVGSPNQYPFPSIDNCDGAISNCSKDHKTQACGCLVNACEFCTDHPAICAGLEDEGVEIFENGEQACATGTACYEDPDPELQPHPVPEMIGEILNRVQIILDTEQGGSEQND